MIEKLAYHLGRNDEEPNIELATSLCETKNSEGIREIVQGLRSEKQQIANDCIKVLYEIAENNAELIADYVMDFLQLLKSKNNRLVWGGMTAIAKIASLRSKEVFEHIDIVIKAYETGSVITRDNSITVFAELARADQQNERRMLDIILRHLSTCRPKEVCQHAERASICINEGNSSEFIEVLVKRREHLTEAQKKKVDRLIRQKQKVG